MEVRVVASSIWSSPLIAIFKRSEKDFPHVLSKKNIKERIKETPVGYIFSSLKKLNR